MSVVDQIWDEAVGGLNWLKSVVLGEWDEDRPISAVVADMLASFIPGVIIVTSARDLTAVIYRLAIYPKKREEVGEWILVVGCAIPLVLPIIAAAAGLAAAGVGAIITGLIGDEAAAVLRSVALLLVEKGGRMLGEIFGFLRRFIKGNIIEVLREIKFVKYAEALVKYLGEFIEKLLIVIRRVRGKLLKFKALQSVAEALDKLEMMEKAFYDVQSRAVAMIPKALAELDSRLAEVLSQGLEADTRAAHTGIPAPHAPRVVSEPQRVPAMPDNGLGRPAGTTSPSEIRPPVEEKPNLHPEERKEPKLGEMPEEHVPCFKGSKLPADKLAEMDRQLLNQQKGLNNMTVQEYLDGRAAYDQSGRGGSGPAQQARENYQNQLQDQLFQQHLDEGYAPAEAEALAEQQAADEMNTLAALHNPDQVAGGANVIAAGEEGMGDRVVNSTIGGQWASNVPEAGTSRVALLDEAANEVPAAERATTKMNVRLKRCE